MAVDSSQLAVDGLPFVARFPEMTVHHLDGVLNLLDVLVHLVLLKRERLLDADEIECVLADGVDLGSEKTIMFLSTE